MKKSSQKLNCPCGGKSYASCCEPFHMGAKAAKTPEQLMRSRYSAYAFGLPAYLVNTWHPDTCPANLAEDLAHPTLKWLELKVHRSGEGGEHLMGQFPAAVYELGEVHFTATFRSLSTGKAGKMTEHSLFVREGENWLYVKAMEQS